MVLTLDLDIEEVQPVGEFTSLPIESSGLPSSGETSLVDDVRHGVHQGFERVVFEFEEGTNLSHSLEYVEEAIPPSGNPVEVAGDVILAVTFAPASGVDLSGEQPEETYDGAERIDIEGNLITELVQVGDFESVLTWAIGLKAPTGGAVTTLGDPDRLVIDLETG